MKTTTGDETTRRDFFRRTAVCLGAAGVATAGGCTIPVRSMRVTRGRLIRIPLARYPELERLSGRLKVVTPDAGAIFVTHLGERSYLALSAICTHQGCTVAPSGRGYRCPCHGSRYDATGQNTGGPAPRPLERFQADRHGDEVVVDLGAVIGARS